MADRAAKELASLASKEWAVWISLASATAWVTDKDPDTGQLMDRDILNEELEKIEHPAGIANAKDFRYEVVKFALRARAKNASPPSAVDDTSHTVAPLPVCRRVLLCLAHHAINI